MRVPSILAAVILLVLGLEAAAISAPASREVVVYLTTAGFSPAATTIALGDRVRFTVRDRKPHQLRKTTGPTSGELPTDVLENQGASVTLMPEDAGTYSYIDQLNNRKPAFRLVVRPH